MGFASGDEMLHVSHVYNAVRNTIGHVAEQSGAKVVEDLVTTPGGDELVMLRDPWGIAVQLVRRAAPMLKTV